MFDIDENSGGEVLREVAGSVLDEAARAAGRGMAGGLLVAVASWVSLMIRWGSPTLFVGAALTALIYLVLRKTGAVDPSQLQKLLERVVRS